jgi:hypothetical protein
MFAGYSRVWGFFGVVAALFMLFGGLANFSLDSVDSIAEVIVGVFTLALSVGALVIGWGVLGSLNLEEKQKRVVFGNHTGLPVDLAKVERLRYDLRGEVLGRFAQRAQGMAATGYRIPADPVQCWLQVAMDPSMRDEALVSGAYTLAHIDASLAQGPEKAQLETAKHALWQKLKQINPPYLQNPG